jgi:hypothetical protein
VRIARDFLLAEAPLVALSLGRAGLGARGVLWVKPDHFDAKERTCL